MFSLSCGGESGGAMGAAKSINRGTIGGFAGFENLWEEEVLGSTMDENLRCFGFSYVICLWLAGLEGLVSR